MSGGVMLKSEMGKDARGGIEEIRHAMRGGE